jgi:hypothetical protein
VIMFFLKDETLHTLLDFSKVKGREYSFNQINKFNDEILDIKKKHKKKHFFTLLTTQKKRFCNSNRLKLFVFCFFLENCVLFHSCYCFSCCCQL